MNVQARDVWRYKFLEKNYLFIFLMKIFLFKDNVDEYDCTWETLQIYEICEME